MFVLYDICCFFFLLLIEIIEILQNFWSLYTFFLLKHEKQTLSYIHTRYDGNKTSFFSPIYFVGGPVFFFLPTLKITWAREVGAPVITWYE